MSGVTASSYKPSTGLRHAQSLDNVSWSSSPRKKQWPAVDENCPIHGSHNKCTCASFMKNNENGVSINGIGSTESLHRSGHFGKQYSENNDNLVSSSIQPFNNNPSLPSTQRDIVGNNLQFNSSYKNDWLDDENDQLAALLLYRDTLKKNLKTPMNLSSGGFPKMRHGRIGSQWRHIKQTNTYSGSNLMFIDGTVRLDDSMKYPIPRFGYPPMKRPQHKFSSSYNDLSSISSNPTAKSFDTYTWSATDKPKQRPSESQQSSRVKHHAKDNSSYWPTDSDYKKNRSTNYPNDDNNDYEVNQPVQERIRHGLD